MGDPVCVLVMENFVASREEIQEINSFSITFKSEENSEKKHSFVTDNSRGVTQWIEALQSSSYERKREALILLQIKLRNKTGLDPLRGTAFETNPVYCGPLPASPALLPAPPVRKSRGKSKTSSPATFTSHLGVENWEEQNMNGREELNNCDPSSNEDILGPNRPSFKSHVPVDNLINF